MDKWTNVLRALSKCIERSSGCLNEPECPYVPQCFAPSRHEILPIELVEDILAVLREQEPRVMTLEEALGAEVNVDQCWLEVKGIKALYLADAVVCPEHLERADIQRWGAGNCQMPLDLYGEHWRMWTRKPTDEQREATSWE